MNWRIIFLFPFAVIAEIIGNLFNFPILCRFANWVADREYGDRAGKWWQTREEANKEK